MHLMNKKDRLVIYFRYRSVANSEDTFKQIGKRIEDVPELVLKLLRRKNASEDFLAKAAVCWV